MNEPTPNSHPLGCGCDECLKEAIARFHAYQALQELKRRYGPNLEVLAISPHGTIEDNAYVKLALTPLDLAAQALAEGSVLGAGKDPIIYCQILNEICETIARMDLYPEAERLLLSTFKRPEGDAVDRLF